MKKLTLIVLAFACLTFAVSSCKKKYEKVIDEYFQETLKDYKSLEIVKMGELEQVSTYQHRLNSAAVKEDWISKPDHLKRVTEFSLQCYEQGYSFIDTLYFRAEVKYRAKNSYGGYVLAHDYLYIDRDLHCVVASQKYRPFDYFGRPQDE